jgi:hypothetical protein
MQLGDNRTLYARVSLSSAAGICCALSPYGDA